MLFLIQPSTNELTSASSQLENQLETQQASASNLSRFKHLIECGISKQSSPLSVPVSAYIKQSLSKYN